MARDHPVCPWVFEWAADLMTRYTHVGDLGKTPVQLIRGSNIAQFGEKILYKPLRLVIIEETWRTRSWMASFWA